MRCLILEPVFAPILITAKFANVSRAKTPAVSHLLFDGTFLTLVAQPSFLKTFLQTPAVKLIASLLKDLTHALAVSTTPFLRFSLLVQIIFHL